MDVLYQFEVYKVECTKVGHRYHLAYVFFGPLSVYLLDGKLVWFEKILYATFVIWLIPI